MSELAQLFNVEPEAVRCPFPIYNNLRETAPLLFVEELDCFVATGYAEAAAILQNHEAFSSEDVTGRRKSAFKKLEASGKTASLEAAELSPSGSVNTFLLASAEPDHARRRGLVDRAFLPPQVRQREGTIRQLCDELIDAFEAGPVEFLRAFAGPLPMIVIASEIGVPVKDFSIFKHWSDVIAGGVGKTLSAEEEAVTLQVLNDFSQYFDRMLELREKQPANDVLTDVAKAKAAGQMTHQQCLDFLRELLVAGNETTTNHLLNTLLMILNHPGTWEKLRADRSLVKKVVEESLRMEAPIQGFYRTALTTTQVGEVTIPEGAMVYVVFQGANLDERQFSEPCAMEIERKNAARHITFGRGPHTCLGAPLARAEGRIALEALLDRFAHATLTAPGEPVDYLSSYINRGPKQLNVLFTPDPERNEPSNESVAATI